MLERSELAATFWVMNFAFTFPEAFGSGEVHFGCSEAFCVSLPPQGYFPQNNKLPFQFMFKLVHYPGALSSFSAAQQMPGKKTGPAPVQQPHPTLIIPQPFFTLSAPAPPNSAVRKQNNSNQKQLIKQ